MSNVKILMALLAACILVMPAISMPDNGNPTIGQDCKQIPPTMGDGAQNPQGCPCQKPMIGPSGQDGKQIPPMMGDGAQNPQGCPCQKPTIGPNGDDGKQIPSMIGDGAQNPQGCTCQKPMIGPNGEDGKQKVCNDQNSAPGELEQGNQQ